MIDTFAVPLILVTFNGSEHNVRGTVAYLPESRAQRRAAFSRSGLNAWVSEQETQPPPHSVAFVVLPTGVRHRVLDRETTGTIFPTTRFQLGAVSPMQEGTA